MGRAIQLKRGTREAFEGAKGTLSSGEICFISDTNELVVSHGDGSYVVFKPDRLVSAEGEHTPEPNSHAWYDNEE